MIRSKLAILMLMLSAPFIGAVFATHPLAATASPPSAAPPIPQATLIQIETLNAHWQAAEGDAALLRIQIRDLQNQLNTAKNNADTATQAKNKSDASNRAAVKALALANQKLANTTAKLSVCHTK